MRAYERHPNFYRLITALEVVADPVVAELYARFAAGFGGTLRGVAEKVDYLAELGVTYLHLLPLLKPRPGADDGGYAVMDYRTVREDLGTMQDLRDLATVLRSRGISLTLDLVLNHVAAEHAWARAARAGRP